MIDLYLDDIRPLPTGWTLARSAEEARDLILTGEVDRASLDHDLGECDECANAFPRRGYPLVTDTCRHKMTGYDLVKWMAETGNWPRSKPVVHSANPCGAENMRATINRYWKSSAATNEESE